MKVKMDMNAVIFKGPFDIAVERRPKPSLIDPTDAIVRVRLAGICGSELHMYRGHQKTGTGHIMGHEFTGTVEQTGPNVTSFVPGDSVVSIFSPVCMKCWFCTRGLTNRCPHSTAFGTSSLNGGQAEYVRVPFADGTLQHAPPDFDDRLLIMMSDIFPTGYYAAGRAVEGLRGQMESRLTSFFSGGEKAALDDAVVVCLGCGPVGICAIATARSMGIRTIFAVDGVADRLEEARGLGAIPLMLGDKDGIHEQILTRTGGRGADAVIESVGSAKALRSAFDMLRPCGVLSSVGFHQGEVPFSALECYQKNLSVSFGRVPVRTVFEDALACLRENQGLLGGYVSHEMELGEAARGFEVFESRGARKVILRVS